MVIDVVVASVDMSKHGNVFGVAILAGDKEEISWYQVEVTSVPVELLGKFSHTQAVVTKL